MTHTHLADMVGGWFVGNFEPTTLKTSACEVALKRYAAGATEAAHVHRIATEVTLIASGRARMCGREFVAGDIITLQPGDVTGFVAIEDTTTVVVKMPSVAGDKYLVEAGVDDVAGVRP
jgi:quercetin dioxygenase-like cupin family protein